MKSPRALGLSFLTGITLAAIPPVHADEASLASTIFTMPMAAAALGTPVTPATVPPDTAMGATTVSRASYTAQDGSHRQIGLLLRRGDSPDQTKDIFESSKSTFKGEDVPGLGDAAYRTKTPAQLDILRGKDWLIINAGTYKEPDPAAQEKAAAAILKALAK
jgi:hypothetical protein